MINGVAPAASAASDPAKAKQLEKLKGAAQQFEAVFLRQMISSMRSASLGDDILGNEASNQFRDLADAETADQMARRGTLGVAEMLLKQFEPRVTGMPPLTQSVEKAPK